MPALSGVPHMAWSSRFRERRIPDGGCAVVQAHNLDAIFNKLARKAEHCEYLNQFESNLRLALKAKAARMVSVRPRSPLLASSHCLLRSLGADLAPGDGVSIVMEDAYRLPLDDA
jgi:hypothetical protein